MERHGASHRITATKTQDPTAHFQPTTGRVIPATRNSRVLGNVEEAEETGLDPSLRTM